MFVRRGTVAVLLTDKLARFFTYARQELQLYMKPIHYNFFRTYCISFW